MSKSEAKYGFAIGTLLLEAAELKKDAASRRERRKLLKAAERLKQLPAQDIKMCLMRMTLEQIASQLPQGGRAQRNARATLTFIDALGTTVV